MTSSKAGLTVILGVWMLLLVTACSFQAPEDRVREFSQTESGFVIYKSDIHFARIEGENAGAWQARAVLKVEICLARTFGWRPMEPGIKFEFDLADTPNGSQQVQVLSTLAAGCVEFEKNISFPFAQKQTTYLKKYLIVHGLQAELQDLTRAQPVYIDPWNQTSLTEWSGNENSLPPQASNAGPLQLRVQNLSLQKIKAREIVIDQDLQLHFRYSYVMTFADQYARLRALSASTQNASLWPEKRFAVRAVLASPPQAAAATASATSRENLASYTRIGGFITSAQSDANGQVRAEVVLQVDLEDIPLLDSRPRLVLDIVPLSSSDQSVPESASLVFSFDPRAEQTVAQPEQSSVKALDFWQLAPTLASIPATDRDDLQLLVKPKTAAAVDPLQSAINNLNLHGSVQHIDVDTIEGLNLPQTPGGPSIAKIDIQAALEQSTIDPAFLNHFAFLYNQQPRGFPGLPSTSDQQRFLANPELFVRWTRFTVVQHVDTTPVEVTADSQTINVIANLFKQTLSATGSAEGARTAYGRDFSDNSSLGFNSLGNGRTWNWAQMGHDESYAMHESTTADGVLVQNGLSRVTNFYADRLQVTLRGEFRQCLVLTFYRPQATDSNFIFCAQKSGVVPESYYFMTDDFHANIFSVVDFKTLRERQLTKSFRGERAFIDIQHILQNKQLHLQFEPSPKTISDPATLPGVIGFENLSGAPLLDIRLQGLVNSLMQVLGSKPPIEPNALYAYLRLTQSNPQQILSTEQGRADFARLGQLILKDFPAARRPYLEILKLIYATLEVHQMNAEKIWLLDNAMKASEQ